MPEPSSMPSVEPLEILALATDLGRRAAALLVDGLTRARTSVITKSTITDMVTEMDRASEQFLVEAILAARPDDGILGEEGTDRTGTSGVRWILDPLDGTTNYLYGHAGFNVSIGVEVAGAGGSAPTTLVGVVVDPLHGDVFSATAGGGTTRNGSPVRCSTETVLAHALVATGFSYDPDRRRRQASTLVEVLPLVRDLRRVGAAATDLCSVACGRVDAYFEKGLAPWDHAAGALIATEAGAIVGNLSGSGDLDEFVLAAPAALFEPLRELLVASGALDA